jgi:hydroxymethylpyrimidine/phosphomethylpyrimidine kinase
MTDSTRLVKPAALTIAGSDSGGGAGIQADLKAMEANGVFGLSVLTAITAQNTQAVTAAFDLPADIIEAQIDAVADDFEIAAVKTGMLSSVAIITVVATRIRQWSLRPLVVDPVMVSKTGFSLLKDDAVEAVREHLLPLARLVTPNAHEAERLTGQRVQTLAEAEAAARAIHAMGPQAVLVKGGHLEDLHEAVDVLFDGEGVHHFPSERLDTPHTHGTGCTYASAIAARLARGEELRTAIEHAKYYVTEAIRHGFALGRGRGPTNHFYFIGEGAPVAV